MVYVTVLEIKFNPNPKTDPHPNSNHSLTVKVEIMHAVQNDTEIKFNLVL